MLLHCHSSIQFNFKHTYYSFLPNSFMASVQVDAATVEEVKSQAEPSTNVPSNIKEPNVHEPYESTEALVPHVKDEETQEVISDEEDEKEMESFADKERDYSPYTSLEQPVSAWPAEVNMEDEDEEDDEYIYKV